MFFLNYKKCQHHLAQHWLNMPLAKKGIVVIALPLAVLLAALGALYFREQALSNLEHQLRISLKNQRDIQTVHTQLLEASNGVRDYLLTGDNQFLTTFNHAKHLLPTVLNNLHLQLEGDAQKNNLDAIRILVNENLNQLDVLANYKAETANDFLIAKFKLQVASLNTIRIKIEDLKAQEDLLIVQDQTNINFQRDRNINTTLIAALAGILGSIFGMYIFSNTIVNRVRLLRDSAAHLARAEPLNLPSSSQDELGQLSDELAQASALLAKNIEKTMLAQYAAEEANKAKSMFLSRTSHELRTPLNAILGFAQILENELSYGPQKEHANTIISAGQHLLKIINEVLDIAKIESNETSISLQPIDINALIMEAVNYISPVGRIRDNFIEAHLQPNLFAMADKQKLLQVVLNLLTNALKYGPPNSTITVTSHKENGTIKIAIQDQGNGIPKHLQNRLFTPFDRLGAEQTKIEGTGLGLAVSKQLILAMGGTIGVDAEKSIFWLTLNPTNGADSITSNHLFASNSLPPHNQKHKNILYVEDIASNKALVEAIIKRQPNLTYYSASTIKEAKLILAELRFDMAIIDLNLPDGNGEELVNYIRKDNANNNMAVLILTADALTETQVTLSQLGIQAFMTKPLNIAEFTLQLQTITKPKAHE
jgi:signal transduction histidine kinase/ActR/RegA family two-component response regulator